VYNPKIIKSNGKIMSVKDKLDQFHYHEALDRLHVVMSTINDHILQHPVCKLEKKVGNKVDKALILLFEAYQEVGEISHTRFKDI
jgi:hypothetical protein